MDFTCDYVEFFILIRKIFLPKYVILIIYYNLQINNTINFIGKLIYCHSQINNSVHFY